MLVIRWFIDALTFTHIDMKRHTEGVIILGKGAIISKSINQKVNMDSSTITDLICTHSMVLEVIWTKYFIEANGYTVDHNIVM